MVYILSRDRLGTKISKLKCPLCNNYLTPRRLDKVFFKLGVTENKCTFEYINLEHIRSMDMSNHVTNFIAICTNHDCGFADATIKERMYDIKKSEKYLS